MTERQILAPVQQTKKQRPSFHLFDFFYRYGTILTIVVLIVVFAAANPAFLQTGNIINILRSISIVTIIAVGLTISLAVNGFDLSVGSVATLSNAIVISMFVWFSQNPLIAILSALAAALIVGLLNALMIVKMKIPDMLMTLAMMFIIQGLAQTYTKGATISENMVLPDGTFSTGTIPAFFSKIGQVPYIILLMAVIVLFAHIFMTYTKHGRFMYIIGGNKEAARLSGIHVNKYKIGISALGFICSNRWYCAGIKGDDSGNKCRHTLFNGWRSSSFYRFFRHGSRKTKCIWYFYWGCAHRNFAKWACDDVCPLLRDGYCERLCTRACASVDVLQTARLTMYFLKPFESRLRLVNGKRCSRRFPKGDDKKK